MDLYQTRGTLKMSVPFALPLYTPPKKGTPSISQCSEASAIENRGRTKTIRMINSDLPNAPHKSSRSPVALGSLRASEPCHETMCSWDPFRKPTAKLNSKIFPEYFHKPHHFVEGLIAASVNAQHSCSSEAAVLPTMEAGTST